MISVIFKRRAGAAGICRLLCAALLLSLALGCAPVPLDMPKPVSVAPANQSGTELARSVSEDGSGRSSYAPLSDGNQALGARLRLIEAAEKTLDLQYFLMKPDLGGALISFALLDAADRGVRVRLLLDDVFTTVHDDDLALINAHPDIDIRIYNPAPRPGAKMLGLLANFQRVNRRMHNKSFTADLAFAIIGGRNIADEYYQLETDSEFADFDMLVTGPAVREISETFDTFWNDGWAVPLESLRKPASAQDLAVARAELKARLEPARAKYEHAVNDPYLQEVSHGRVPIYRGATQVVTDPPSKLKVPVPEGRKDLAEALLGRIRDARSDVIVITPYFVPEDYGAKLFADLARRGVRVRIVTNSIGSTNHTYVHAGYRRHRKDLLAAGVELYELRADALQALGEVDQAGQAVDIVMHTKLAVIDQKEVFVGSLNFDPRSIKINSELGVFIDSPRLAAEMNRELDEGLSKYTYQVRLSETGGLEWRYIRPYQITVTRREPGSTLWKQLVVGLTAILPVEGQL